LHCRQAAFPLSEWCNSERSCERLQGRHHDIFKGDCCDPWLWLVGFLAAIRARGSDRNFLHLGTYARCVKLLYPFFSMPSRICRYRINADLQQKR